jgi:biopolymer transport protein ExbD
VAFTASSGHTRTSLAEINITPLVDVVLVLLIIFMVTAPVLQSGIDVSVPKTRSVKEITQQRMVLTWRNCQRYCTNPIRIQQTRSFISGPMNGFPLARSPRSWMRSNKPGSATSAL